MKVTIIPIVIGALGTVTKGLINGLEDLEIRERVETIQTTAVLRSARILRRVMETWGDFARELKKVMKRESNSDTNYNWCTRNSSQMFG